MLVHESYNVMMKYINNKKYQNAYKSNRKLAKHDCSVCVGSESIQPATVVRDLGAYLDAELTMNQHVSMIAAASFFHLRRLRQIRRRVGTEVTILLVLTLITSRLDYCNSLLAGAPQSTLGVLQCVQNAAARLIFELGPRDHVTDSLIHLHWLPIRWRVQYKLVMLVYGIVVGTCPEYLRTIVEPATPSHPELRSAACSAPKFVVPRLRTKFSERAFSFSGPVAWNSLPADIR